MNDDREAVQAVLRAFDEALAGGDAASYAATFAPDGRLLLLYRDALEGRAAIHDDSLATFATWDTSAWRTSLVTLDVCGDRAWSLSTYTETLVRHDDGRRRVIAGRILRILRREPDGWRVEVAMNAHSQRAEELPPAAG